VVKVTLVFAIAAFEITPPVTVVVVPAPAETTAPLLPVVPAFERGEIIGCVIPDAFTESTFALTCKDELSTS
jgi:hypothetical protein